MSDTLHAALTHLDVPAEAQEAGIPVLAYAIDGKIADADIQAIRADVAGHEAVRLLVRIDGFAMPASNALTSGLINLIKMKVEVVQRIERYAIVGGPDWIGASVGVLGGLMPFGIKHFDDETTAWAWVGGGTTADEAEDRAEAEHRAAPAVTLLPSHRSDLVAFHVDGHLTDLDYKTVATPAIEAALREHDAIDLLVRFGTFEGASLGAMADDAALAQHLGSFRRLALVSAPDWLAAFASGADALVPVEVETFDEEAQARAWLRPAA